MAKETLQQLGIQAGEETGDSETVQAYVVLTGLGPGEHRMVVEVDVPASLTVVSVTPAEVDVVIRRAAERRGSAVPTTSR